MILCDLLIFYFKSLEGISRFIHQNSPAKVELVGRNEGMARCRGAQLYPKKKEKNIKVGTSVYIYIYIYTYIYIYYLGKL